MVMVSIVKVPKGRTDPDGYAERQRKRKDERGDLILFQAYGIIALDARGVCAGGMPKPPDEGYFVHCAGDNVSAGS